MTHILGAANVPQKCGVICIRPSLNGDTLYYPQRFYPFALKTQRSQNAQALVGPRDRHDRGSPVGSSTVLVALLVVVPMQVRAQIGDPLADLRAQVSRLYDQANYTNAVALAERYVRLVRRKRGGVASFRAKSRDLPIDSASGFCMWIK